MTIIKHKFPSYAILHRGDPGYDAIFKILHTTPEGMNGLTVIQVKLPAAMQLTDREFVIARYVLDRIMAGTGQTCFSLNKQAANADIFFDMKNTISGLEQLHAMAHLLLAYLAIQGDVPLGSIADAFFEHPVDSTIRYVVFTVPLWPEDGLHGYIVELWASFQALLNGSIEGEVALLLPHAP